MAEIFVYPEDFLFPEDRSFTTGDQTPLDRSVCDDREQDFSAHQNHHDNHDENSTLSTGTTRHLQQQRQQQHMNHAVRLPEEPPLVPPSLFGDDGEAGIEFRSSFLFQSSCYLPDDESESDCSPVEVKKSPLQRHETIKPWKPNLPDQLEGSADQTGSTSSDENVRVAKRLMDRFEPSSRKRTWKDPRHHHIEFRSNQSIHNVSVSDKTRKIDPSYRGYRIYIPGAGNNQGDGHDNLSIDPMDDFTVPEALTRAGMSTLSFDADRFFGFAIPQTNKHRWACGMVIVSFLAAVAAVSATCGMGYCTGQRSSALRPTSNPSSTPPETDTDLGGGTAMPTSSPSLLILPPPPTPGRIAFQSNVELNRAVDDYLAGDSSKSSTVAQEYGHPIGVWNVQYLTNFSHVFDARRNPLAATFNEDLNSWNVARATTMEGMFFGAETFNGNISSWNTGSVTKMKELLSKAGSFKGDLSQWDVSSVISMEGMFQNAHDFDNNLGRWDTSSVMNMDRVFINCYSFQGRGLNSWDTRNVDTMMLSFANTPRFKGVLSDWNVARVYNMKGTFQQAVSFNSDLSKWDLSSAKDISGMFMHAMLFNSEVYAWNTSSVTDMSYTFFGASSFNGDISTWDVAAVKNLTKMAAGATRFNCNLCPWQEKLSKKSGVVTTSMFLSTSCPSELDPDLGAKQNSTFCYDCHVVTSTPPDSEIADIFADVDTPPPQTSKENSVGLLQFFNKEELARAIDTYLMNWTIRKNESEIYGYPIGSWDVSLVTDFSNIFDSLRNSAVSTFDADLSDWNTSSAEFMVSTFAGASSFTGDVSNWSTNKVTSMQGMFSNADLFNGDLSLWDTSNVRNMDSMFNSAISFTGIGLESWNTTSVTTMRAMFEDADALMTDLGAWNVGNVVDMASIFQYAGSFNGDISLWDVSKVVSFNYGFSGATSFNRDLSSWNVRSAVTFEGMFAGARGFNQNLCEWSSQFSEVNNAAIFSGMFVASGCLTTDDPDSYNPAAGPLCQYCDR